uniref:LIM zinc-binding domain-containing protein n=1 Tax=Otus sunia TaxID=257818 RepID=A0A8C8B027_9STRI
MCPGGGPLLPAWPRVSPALLLSPQLMSLPSPAWPQRDEPPPCGTATGLPPASSDSDSGCALEEYLEPPADPPEVGSTPPASPADRIRLRARALLQQLPPQDCDERYCPDLAEEEKRQLRAFSARRRREALGQGLACPVPGPCHGCPCKKCGRRLNKGDPGISASRLGDQFWHPSCFSCHFCHQPLVDLIYFQQDGRIYCGRHHAELFRPRCASCDQVGARQGRGFYLPFGVVKNQSPAAGCGGRVLAQGCRKSLLLTRGCLSGADSEEATHQGLHWHARAACFCCSLCRKPLRGQPLTSRHGRLFCSETCSLGRDASSTASDSSDSAFASAPSPDSTPLSRAGPAGRTAPGTGSTSAAGGCRQRVEGAGGDPTATWREESGSTTRLCSAPGYFRGPSRGRNPTQGWSSDDGSPTHLLQEGERWRLGLGWSNRPVHPKAAARGAGQAQPSSSSPILAFPLPEALLEQGSVHPAFRSPEDCGAAAKERSRDAVHTGMLGPPTGHPSTPQPSTEGLNEPGALGQPVLGDPDPRTPAGNGDPHFGAGTSPARHSPQPEDIDLQDITEEDDSWCPTCSSSSDSDSEEEGFFFGKPIPKPGMSSLGREPLGRARGTTAKQRGSSKHCSVS